MPGATRGETLSGAAVPAKQRVARRPRRGAAADRYGALWRALLWPPFLVALGLLAVPQIAFVALSLHRNLGMGRVDQAFTAANYVRVLTDPLYLGSIWTTFALSLGATLIALAVAFPTAYLLARLRSRWVSFLVVLLLISSFVTIVIKVLGLSLLLGQEGPVNQALGALGLVDAPVALTNNAVGVLVGLVQYTLPLLVMLLFGVVQTIPISLEEAAELHGATWPGT